MKILWEDYLTFKEFKRNVKALILSLLLEHIVGLKWTLFHEVTVNSQLSVIYGECGVLVT